MVNVNITTSIRWETETTTEEEEETEEEIEVSTEVATTGITTSLTSRTETNKIAILANSNNMAITNQ